MGYLSPKVFTMDYDIIENKDYNYYVYDYKSSNKDEIQEYKDSTYSQKYEIADNNFPEVVSYNLYSDANYYDLVQLLSEREMLWDRPLSEDKLQDVRNFKVGLHFTADSQFNITNQFLTDIIGELNQREIKENLEKRQITSIKEEYLSEFLKEVKYKF